MMHSTIFRLYDIRGKVGSEFVIDEVYNLARAIAYYFINRNQKIKRVILAIDGRHHSPMIRDYVCSALQDSGLEVWYAGVCPSPVIYFAMHTMDVDAGLIITASHNPKEYNGIKICFGKEMVWGNGIKRIEQLFVEKKNISAIIRGTYQEVPIIDQYVTWMSDHVAHLKKMKLHVVIDCGNGTAGVVLKKLIAAMSWSHVELLYEEVDGNYPHHEADPTVEENMRDLKKTLLNDDSFDVGIGLDGDGDRMGAMTPEGFLIPGDRLLGVFACSVVRKNPGAVVVFDVKSSLALIKLLDLLGATSVMSATGHALIKDSMEKNGGLLGGELSCHFFFHDKYFGYDDGIYAMIRLFEIMVESKKSLTDLLSIIPSYHSSPEYRIFWEESSRDAVIENLSHYFQSKPGSMVSRLDGMRATLPYGWVLARVSHTQPVLSVRFESETNEGLTKLKKDFMHVLLPYNRKDIETILFAQ